MKEDGSKRKERTGGWEREENENKKVTKREINEVKERRGEKGGCRIEQLQM